MKYPTRFNTYRCNTYISADATFISLTNTGTLMRLLLILALFTISNVHAEPMVYKTFNDADRQLNLIYQEYIKKLDGDKRVAFVKTQKAWIDYKELDCNFQTYGKEGKESMSALSECYKEHAESRIKIINEYNTCNEQEPGCPALK
jgi:uncharacterized protein YecT (DUF1311 family)